MIELAFALLGRIADGWTTHKGLSLGYRERNPFARFVMQRIGYLPWWLATVALTIYGTLNWPWMGWVIGGGSFVAAGLNWRLVK